MRASIAGVQVAVPGYDGRVVEAVVKAACDRVDELHPLRGPGPTLPDHLRAPTPASRR